MNVLFFSTYVIPLSSVSKHAYFQLSVEYNILCMSLQLNMMVLPQVAILPVLPQVAILPMCQLLYACRNKPIPIPILTFGHPVYPEIFVLKILV